MSIWVTGAKGFVGGYLARELADAGPPFMASDMARLEDPDKHRLGLQLWINGEIDATNLNALATRSGLPSSDLPSRRWVLGWFIDYTTL